MKKATTLINEAARKALDISRDDYALCAYLHYRQGYPNSKKSGWCIDPKDDVADFVGISRQGLYKMIRRMEDLGLIESDPISGFVRATARFIDTDCKQSLHETVNKVYTDCKQSLHETVNKVDTIKEDNKRENKEDILNNSANAHFDPQKENEKKPVEAPFEKKFAPAPRRAAPEVWTYDDVIREVQKRNPAAGPFAAAVREIWAEWIEYRCARRIAKYAGLMYEVGAVALLYDLSDGDPEKAKKIVNNSITNHWQGLFALKQPAQPKKSVQENQNDLLAYVISNRTI